MKKTIFTLTAIMAIALFSACDGSLYYSHNESVDEHGWLPSDSTRFDVDIDDTTTLFNFMIGVRNSISYPYSNTFLFITTTFPDGSIACDTMEYPLADPSGAWYGCRSGRYVDTRYYFRRNARFPMTGTYHFAITNGMRDSAIVGIKDIGFRVEYSKTK